MSISGICFFALSLMLYYSLCKNAVQVNRYLMGPFLTAIFGPVVAFITGLIFSRAFSIVPVERCPRIERVRRADFKFVAGNISLFVFFFSVAIFVYGLFHRAIGAWHFLSLILGGPFALAGAVSVLVLTDLACNR